jgi:leucyl-tRNA synthetase
MFMGPLEATKPWQTSQLAGVVRFRDRVVALVDAGFHEADFSQPHPGSLSLIHPAHS